MQRKKYKGRWEKRQLTKSGQVCRFHCKIQSVYANQLEADDDITEIRCNVLLEGVENGEYTTDFLCKKKNGSYMVRECVVRKQLTWLSVVKLLDVSLSYWRKHGIEDWGLVIEKEDDHEEE